MRWSVVRGVAALVVVIMTAACSSTVPGTAGPARDIPVAALPFDEAGRIFAEQMAVFRSWDVCATHDIAAAERVAAATAFAIRPNGGLERCEVALLSEDGNQVSYLTIEVAEIVPGPATTPPVTVGNRGFDVVDTDPEATAEECGYARPVALGWGLIVRGEVVGDAARSCAIAGEYLTAVLPRLDRPARHADGGTEPAFAIALHDPCAALVRLAPEFVGGAEATTANATASMTGPRSCTLTRVPSPGAITVTSQLVQFERDVDGQSGFFAEGVLEATYPDDAGCTVTREIADNTLLSPGFPYLFRPAIAIGAPDCATARRYLDQVVAVPLEPAVPTAGAARLGALDMRPGSADVGAPFDPCTTVDWNAYPAEVRPFGVDPRPIATPVEPDDVFLTGCDYNSASVSSSILWGPPNRGFTTDPTVRSGVFTQFAGRPGLEDFSPGETPEEGPACFSFMQLSNGLVAVATVGENTTADLCGVNRVVLETLAPLVP